MRKPLRTSSIALVVLAGVAAPRLSAQSISRPAADGVDRAAANWARIRTVRGSFEMTVTNPLTGSSATSRGQYAQERPNHLSIRFDDQANGAIVADGSAVWVYLPSSAPGQVIKRPATDRSAAPVDLAGQFLEAPRTKYDITPAGTKTVDGHAAQGFTLVPKPGATAPFTKALVWIDDDDSLIREFQTTEGSGITRLVHLTSIAVNTAIDPGTFVFTVPKGVKVIDQTSSR